MGHMGWQQHTHCLGGRDLSVGLSGLACALRSMLVFSVPEVETVSLIFKFMGWVGKAAGAMGNRWRKQRENEMLYGNKRRYLCWNHYTRNKEPLMKESEPEDREGCGVVNRKRV